MPLIDLTLIVLFWLSVLMIGYHHFGYPLLLKVVTKRAQPRTKRPLTPQDPYPSITLIVPAYNEQQWIAEKIRNCAMLAYPRHRLHIQIHCDGCSDDTAEVARQSIQEMICADTFIEVIEHEKNRGKVAILNPAMQNVTSDITVFTDTSALISFDALMIAREHFANPKVGVVNGKYMLFEAATEGEEVYWQYQNQLKKAEANLATTIGSHGALYMIRTPLFTPLVPNTINDDFVLPMKIVEQGYLSVYDADVISTELEASPGHIDFARRIRISAGNMQQVLLLFRLFNPKFKRIAFAFASGKGLRVLIPYLLLSMLLSSLLLCEHPFYLLLFVAQLSLYLFTAMSYKKKVRFRPLQWLNYLVIGHTANLIGGLSYVLHRTSKPKVLL